jgi:AraC-like DNA-binding protein
MLVMAGRPLPRDVTKAIDLLRSDLGRLWRITELAAMCGVPRRTLEKHFKHFAGCSPLEFLRNERFDQVRRKLSHASPEMNVTEIATECGFNHRGRFALIYRGRYGESPSDTIRWGRIPIGAKPPAFRMAAPSELPMVLSADQKAHSAALELLERAMELAPRDPLQMSLAACCHGLRAGHHFTNHPEAERDDALRLASNASILSAGDPVADTMLSAAFMLAHDLHSAESHARRALAVDGGSAWGWGRVAWVYAYRGEAARAIESCQFAHVLAPADPLSFLWSIGIAAANFELGHYDRAVGWYQRALAGQPKVVWINRILAPALVMPDR